MNRGRFLALVAAVSAVPLVPIPAPAVRETLWCTFKWENRVRVWNDPEVSTLQAMMRQGFIQRQIVERAFMSAPLYMIVSGEQEAPSAE